MMCMECNNKYVPYGCLDDRENIMEGFDSGDTHMNRISLLDKMKPSRKPYANPTAPQALNDHLDVSP